ncbi:hypothetical protein K7432_006403 [Basidiobolus ranarum]|uniref:RRM domain-containing protein n=1 Tax=Basidiobolus ranarum TaxID=34480 RepID=A0ABR2WUY0_9FUNG
MLLGIPHSFALGSSLAMSRKTLFVVGFGSSLRARDLAYEFERYGRLVRCDIPAPKGYSSRLFAFVEFEDCRDAEDAYVEMHGRKLDGHTLSVQWAKNAPPRGWRGAGSRSPCRSRSRSYSHDRSRSPHDTRKLDRSYSRSHSPRERSSAINLKNRSTSRNHSQGRDSYSRSSPPARTRSLTPAKRGATGLNDRHGSRSLSPVDSSRKMEPGSRELSLERED